MKTAPAAQRIHTACVLGLAMLISSVSVASSKPGGDAYRKGVEPLVERSPTCTRLPAPRTSLFHIMARSPAAPCEAGKAMGDRKPPIRLASPLSESRFYRPADNVRYAF